MIIGQPTPPNGAFTPFLNPFWQQAMIPHPQFMVPFAPMRPVYPMAPMVPQPKVSAKSPAPSKPKIFRPWDEDTSPETSPTTSISQLQQQVTDFVGKPSGDSENDRQAALELIATNMGKTVSGHRCIYCGKMYSRKYGLKIHLRTHTGFKPLHCKVCNRAFGDPSNLNKHTRLHAENDSAFKCHLCGKLLVRKRDLDRHLSSRHTDTQVLDSFPEDIEIEVV